MITPPPRRRRRTATRIADYILMTVGTLIFAAPILYMIIGSLKPHKDVLDGLGGFVPKNMSFNNYHSLFERFNSPATGYYADFFLTSLLVTTIVVIGGLIVNSMAAYAFARLRWRGRDVIYGCVMALIVLPFEAIAVPLFYLLNDHRDTIWVQAVPFISNGISIYLLTTFFLSLPKELEESAGMDGAGPWRVFFQIVVPLSKPAFATVAIVTFLTQWGSFLWPVLMVSDPQVRPLPLAISVFLGQPPYPWGEFLAFGVLMVTPVLVVFLVFQRWFVRSIASSGVKG